VGVDIDDALYKCREMTSDGKYSRDRCINEYKMWGRKMWEWIAIMR
jgi:hypothetical protein